MTDVSYEKAEELKREWTDQYVRANPDRAELRRFKELVGRVITVNYTGKALVDFADGAWYDIPATDAHLIKVSAEEAKGKYDPKANSAQPIPDKQG